MIKGKTLEEIRDKIPATWFDKTLELELLGYKDKNEKQRVYHISGGGYYYVYVGDDGQGNTYFGCVCKGSLSSRCGACKHICRALEAEEQLAVGSRITKETFACNRCNVWVTRLSDNSILQGCKHYKADIVFDKKSSSDKPTEKIGDIRI